LSDEQQRWRNVQISSATFATSSLQARASVASAVNTHLTLFYWQIGRRIREDILQGKRAGYGKEILQTLSAICCEVWERILGQASPAHVRFAELFPG